MYDKESKILKNFYLKNINPTRQESKDLQGEPIFSGLYTSLLSCKINSQNFTSLKFEQLQNIVRHKEVNSRSSVKRDADTLITLPFYLLNSFIFLLSVNDLPYSTYEGKSVLNETKFYSG